MPSARLMSSLLAFSVFASTLAQDCSKTCQSFGRDFVDGGAYFQNVASTDPFTAQEYFEGCQNDFAYNVLQDPAGNQYECDNTPLLPDDTTQNMTCPITKNQLSSGVWSIIVLSNNGQCEPIDYIRTFTLNVGTQITSTVAPTVTAHSTSTPIVTATSTVTQVITTTAPPKTTTLKSANPSTVTSTPRASITIVITGVVELTQTVNSPSVVSTQTTTITTACSPRVNVAFKKQKADQTNTGVKITVIPNLTVGTLNARNAVAEPTARAGSLEFKRAMLNGRTAEPEAEAAENELVKRAPDAPTVTVTTGSAITTTIFTILPTTTLGATVTVAQTFTTTPTVTVTSGQSPPATVTAPTPTSTFYIVVPVAATQTTKYSTTITATATATTCA